MTRAKPNIVFLTVLLISVVAHVVVLAYIKLPQGGQRAPLKIEMVMKKQPVKKKTRPKPEPIPEKPAPKPEPRKVARVPAPVKPVRQPPPPQQITRPDEPPKSDSIVISDTVPEVAQDGTVSSEPNGVPGGSGDKPSSGVEIATTPDPDPSPPQIDYDALWRGYAVSVVKKIESGKQYPSQAKRRRQTGACTVRFTVSRSGAVSAVSVITSSGHSVLDKEAVAAVQRAAPFAPIPEALDAGSKTMTVKLRFQLQ